MMSLKILSLLHGLRNQITILCIKISPGVEMQLRGNVFSGQSDGEKPRIFYMYQSTVGLLIRTPQREMYSLPPYTTNEAGALAKARYDDFAFPRAREGTILSACARFLFARIYVGKSTRRSCTPVISSKRELSLDAFCIKPHVHVYL